MKAKDISKELVRTEIDQATKELVRHINKDHKGKSVGKPLDTCHQCIFSRYKIKYFYRILIDEVV